MKEREAYIERKILMCILFFLSFFSFFFFIFLSFIVAELSL